MDGTQLPGDSAVDDSNVITPGTPFMQRLSTYLHRYVAYRVSTDAAWNKCQVVISDSSVPGEGEHKIMSHIRHLRQQEKYDADQTHVVYGLDADLIMLTLASHEPRFFVLREVVFMSRGEQVCHLCGTLGHSDEHCPSQLYAPGERSPICRHLAFQLTDIMVLRQCLADEFARVQAQLSERHQAWERL